MGTRGALQKMAAPRRDILATLSAGAKRKRKNPGFPFG
jgi:hypothetical protein